MQAKSEIQPKRSQDISSSDNAKREGRTTVERMSTKDGKVGRYGKRSENVCVWYLSCFCVLSGCNRSWLSFNEESCAGRKKKKKNLRLGQQNIEKKRGERGRWRRKPHLDLPTMGPGDASARTHTPQAPPLPPKNKSRSHTTSNATLNTWPFLIHARTHMHANKKGKLWC